jgi:hypothetical protein
MKPKWTAFLLVLVTATFCVSVVYVAAQGIPGLPGQQERRDLPSAPGRQEHQGPAAIPAGAAVTVRTDTEIAVGTAQPGDIFPATLDEDIVDSGRVLVRRGAPAEIRLMKVREDADEVAFKLYSITARGEKLRVVSDTAREAARKQAPQPQQPGLGGALGQIVGGALGTSGGMSWTGATKQEARVPAGTFLEFTLREQVNLK